MKSVKEILSSVRYWNGRFLGYGLVRKELFKLIGRKNKKKGAHGKSRLDKNL